VSEIPRHFIHRRIHSLLGIIPLGFFLLQHLYLNAKALGPDGVRVFNEAIQSLTHVPFFVFLEILFLYIPLLFHALYGLMIIYQGRSNVTQYASGGNVRFVLQRISGVIALVFIGYHVYETRLLVWWTSTPMDYLWMVRIFETSWKIWFYLAGSTVVIFHFLNGLWSAGIVWGVTVSPAAQREKV